jgi:hypothetical protein
VKHPFTEKKSGRFYIREFTGDVSSEELVWHRDREDRVIKIVESSGWMLQIDNELPVELREGDVHNIPAYKFHRVIKGSSPLKIIVEKKVKPLNTLLEEIEGGKEFFVLGYLSNAYRYGPQREYFWAGPFASRKEAQALADRKQKYGPAKKFKDWMAGFSRIIMGRERFLRAAEKAGIQPRMDMIEGGSLDEVKKGDTVSYKKNGRKATGKVVVPDARGPLVGIDPKGPDEMDMVPEDEISESDKPHLRQYGAPQGSKRDKQLDQTKADLKKAAELKKQGKTKQAEKLKQKAYRRRERMEKKERGKKSFKNVPRKDTKNESRDLQRIRSIIREELSKKTKATLRKKAEERGLTPGSVEQEYKKGLAAWASSGSRKGMSQHQWAMARVNSANPSKKWAVVKKSKAKKKK